MREILFRGKRIDNGEWLYGGYYVIPDGEGGAIHRIAVSDCERFEYNDVVVDPSSISEFIGLTDKNGKKIFEGDIVKVSSPAGSSYYAKIEYDCGCYWISNPNIQIPDTINNFNMEFVEVIGNIHDELLDNPELLEDKL